MQENKKVQHLRICVETILKAVGLMRAARAHKKGDRNGTNSTVKLF